MSEAAMNNRDLLTDVSIFLRETLAKEKLSEHAEICRKQLLQKLDFRDCSPQAYIDMNVSTKGELTTTSETALDLSECYELLNDAKTNKDKEATELKSSVHTQPVQENTYYNIPSLLTQSLISNEQKSDASIKPINKTSSTTNSKQNSIKSVTKDNFDRISESSSTMYSSSSKSDEIGEVLTISASALRYSAAKYGPISRKEKFFFVELSKQYWAALLNHTLYIYTNEKDNKPVLEVDIAGYQARPVVLRESNKKDFSFEVIAPGKKTYQFIAESGTEMEQWILAICQSGKINDLDLKSDIELTSTKETVRQLPSIPLAETEYDHPESGIRPVVSPQHQVYEMMQEPADGLYYYIEHHGINENVSTKNENSIYKNVNDCEEDDNMYYNLIPCADNEECIYDVITEKNKETNPKAIKQISQNMETPKTECPAKNSTPTGLIIQDEIYELVN